MTVDMIPVSPTASHVVHKGFMSVRYMTPSRSEVGRKVCCSNSPARTKATFSGLRLVRNSRQTLRPTSERDPILKTV